MSDFNIESAKLETKKLAKKYRLSLVVLFGSRASGKTHKKSDVDLAFISKREIRPIDIGHMQTEFSKRLKFKKLDFVDLKTASPLLLKQIALKSIMLYEEKPLLFLQFKIYALKRFMEAKDLLNLRKSSLNKFLQRI